MFSNDLCWEPIILMQGSCCIQRLDLARPVIKQVQVMDSLGSLTVPLALLQTAPPVLPLLCLLAHPDPQALFAHKGPSVKLLCANWTTTDARCFPSIPNFVICFYSFYKFNSLWPLQTGTFLLVMCNDG